MALSTALMLAPTALRTVSNVTGIGKAGQSDLEKQLMSMAEVFKAEGMAPVTETTAFKTGQSQLDNRDRRNRTAINNSAAGSGATDEAKIATMGSANDSYSQGLMQLLNYATQIRDQNRGRYLNTIGAADSAKNARIGRNNQAWDSILGPLSQAGGEIGRAHV